MQKPGGVHFAAQSLVLNLFLLSRSCQWAPFPKYIMFQRKTAFDKLTYRKKTWNDQRNRSVEWKKYKCPKESNPCPPEHRVGTLSMHSATIIHSSWIAHFWVLFCLCLKSSIVQNFFYENEFDLHENELVGEKHFHKNGFALRLVLRHRPRPHEDDCKRKRL